MQPSYLLALLVSCLAEVEEAVDFVRDVRPILRRHCYACHGPEKQKSGLRLDIREAVFEGGDLYGPSVVSGKPDESPLITFVRDEDADLTMPPEGDPLSDTYVRTLSRWVAQGAHWPDGVDLAQLEDRTDHWAFRPFSKTKTVPPPTDNAWSRSPIDRFIEDRLARERLSPNSPADRSAWLRRVTLDLTGLPPTPEEIREFSKEDHPSAFEKVVDRLLASPRYGERWAQHWLDVVRYADTHGFEVNTERPNAWPYRDYVIRCLNADVPYDRFVREQIAGDAFGQDAGTGFLVTSSVLLPGQIGKDAASMRAARQDAIDEMVVNIGQTFLGLSIACARCHDHKFDPISQREYYAMQAFVAGVEYGERRLRTPDSRRREAELKKLRHELAMVEGRLRGFRPLALSGSRRPAIRARMNVDRFPPTRARRVRFTISKTNRLEPCIDEFEVFSTSGRNLALASNGAIVTSSGNTFVEDRHELRFINDGEYGNSRSWMSDQPGKGWIVLELPEEAEIDCVVWGRDRNGKFSDRLATEYRIEVSDKDDRWQVVASEEDRAPFLDGDESEEFDIESTLDSEQAMAFRKLEESRKDLERRIRSKSTESLAFVGRFREPDRIRVLRRGDPEQPLEDVSPGVPQVLGDLALGTNVQEQDRRIALANWIASDDNVLTARVLMNRIWQGHFGRGLVDTSNDFGRNGVPPTHPELLDWLATDFVRRGWSIKAMHRQIVLSATYRQSSEFDGAAEMDADARLLWRFPIRRMEGEAIRDSVLAVSGNLNTEMGGRGFDLFDKRGGLTGFEPVVEFPASGLRRMIYAHRVRRERDAIFGVFDCPDGGQSTPRRRESTTPLQALNLLNSRFMIDQADVFAERVAEEVGSEISDQIERAYWLALGRDPTSEEMADATAVVAQHGLATLGRAIFNSNEFLFVP